MTYPYRLPRSISTTLLCLVCSCIGTSATFALEGGDTSSNSAWSNVSITYPDAITRQKELRDRQAAIQADIARLEARLQRVPDESRMNQLHEELNKVKAAYGWEPKSELVYGIRSLDPMLKGQNTMPKELLAAFVQLNKDLRARGIDLIITPMAPTPHFHAHTLVDGIGPEDEYYPGWTEMVIEMLKADLEVIDTVEEFRREAENPILVSWVNDFHTGSMGRQIVAQAIAKRLQRYDFARDLIGNSNKWTANVKEMTGCSFPQRITTVNRLLRAVRKDSPEAQGVRTWPNKHPREVMVMAPDAPKNLEEHIRGRKFKYVDLSKPDDLPLKLDVVLIGDSQLHSSVYGSGLPDFIMKEVGATLRWGSKSWKGFSPPEIYLEVVPDDQPKPRVVVLSFLPKYFWHSYSGDKIRPSKYTPRPLPPFKGKIESVGDPSTAAPPTGPFEATVRITAVSEALDPDEHPDKVDYDEALLHIAAVVEDGPMKGQEIGLRLWVMKDRELIDKVTNLQVGAVGPVVLDTWSNVIRKDRKLGQHMIYNDTDQGLIVPVYFIIGGPLGPEALLEK